MIILLQQLEASTHMLTESPTSRLSQWLQRRYITPPLTFQNEKCATLDAPHPPLLARPLTVLGDPVEIILELLEKLFFPGESSGLLRHPLGDERIGLSHALRGEIEDVKTLAHGNVKEQERTSLQLGLSRNILLVSTQMALRGRRKKDMMEGKGGCEDVSRKYLDD
jgi:hypothetical protein